MIMLGSSWTEEMRFCCTNFNIAMISDECLLLYNYCMLFILGILGAIVGSLIFLVLFVTVVVVAVKR